MEKVTDQEIRTLFLPEEGFSATESGLRNCLADAAVRLNNLLPDGEHKGHVMMGLDQAMVDGIAALTPQPVQPAAPAPSQAVGVPASSAGTESPPLSAVAATTSAAPPASSGPGTEPTSDDAGAPPPAQV